MTDTAKPAPQPLTVALTRLLASFPRRKMPDKYLGMYFYMNASLQIHDLLDTWTRHEVKQLKIGPFTMDDAAIQKSFRLPVWVKEERGPHADCSIDETQVRQDVILLGTYADTDAVVNLGLMRGPDEVLDKVIGISGPRNYHYGTLESFLATCQKRAAAQGLPSALILS
ncbi:MAG TPA: hypothetical protein PKI49_06255 [Pseudomonadota bacterium]|jgi:hypothetical protein|nr:hypothetical protein [Pseudomonadota bacterium]HNF96297.1 hypothetical protein [Pseudomonadota bacterium]HNI59403.1 hypothetical protein [Pseudomonadota bacterium]HNK45083.1 hypothetical protein [Pseudomonadota bacterium]HNN49896.1 hypothetical protein [Pseudomonadota bacterium]